MKSERVIVKEQLFLKCGTVDMYDMEKYSKQNLTLHHFPPFHITKHTVFNESYLLTRTNHDYIEYLARTNKNEYQKVMKEIKDNKQLLMEMR